MYSFSRAKKLVFQDYLFSRMASFCKFCEYLFLRMTSFWKFRVYKFQTQRKKNKKKTVELKNIRLMFLSRLTERQVTMEKLLLLTDSKKSWIKQHFMCIFFSCIYFFEIWILCIFAVYLFLQMPFKKNVEKNLTKIHKIRENM